MALRVCRGCRAWEVYRCYRTFHGLCLSRDRAVREAGQGQCKFYQARAAHVAPCPWHGGTPCLKGNLANCLRQERRDRRAGLVQEVLWP